MTGRQEDGYIFRTNRGPIGFPRKLLPSVRQAAEEASEEAADSALPEVSDVSDLADQVGPNDAA